MQLICKIVDFSTFNDLHQYTISLLILHCFYNFSSPGEFAWVYFFSLILYLIKVLVENID